MPLSLFALFFAILHFSINYFSMYLKLPLLYFIHNYFSSSRMTQKQISSQAKQLYLTKQSDWCIKVVYRHRYASVNQGVMYKGCQKCRGTMYMYTALHSGVMYKRRPQATSCPKKVAWGARDPKFSLLATFHLGRLPTPSQPTYIHPHPPTRIS